jgi:hypothetical protein
MLCRKFGRSGKRLLLWFLLGSLTLFLTSCTSITTAGTRFGSPFTELSHLALWSIGWFLPLPIIWVIIAADQPETRTLYGHASDGDRIRIKIPTGRIIAGHPKLATWIVKFWFVAYPVACLYYKWI